MFRESSDKNNTSGKSVTLAALLMVLVCASFLLGKQVVKAITDTTSDEKTQELDAAIQDQQKDLEAIEKKIDFYNRTIEIKQQEQLTLESQLSLLDTNISKTDEEMKQKEKEISLLQLEIQEKQGEIGQKNEEIHVQKRRIADTLSRLYVREKKTPLQITTGYHSLSQFFTELTYTEEVEKETKKGLDTLQKLRDDLKIEKQRVEDKQNKVKEVKKDLAARQEDLKDEKKQREDILQQTQADEQKFQEVVKAARSEQEKIDSDIQKLESDLRKRLADLETSNSPTGDTTGENDTTEDVSDFGGDIALSWPIPSRDVSCGFHCEGYPFKRFFEHSGIDIRTPQGTEIRAAATGYVAIAKDGGQTGYSYIMLVHGNDYSTVYGHVSQINASTLEKLQSGGIVRRGEVIGLSGGAPGTPGAGAYSTGSHLHFELRKNGIPINPAAYLP